MTKKITVILHDPETAAIDALIREYGMNQTTAVRFIIRDWLKNVSDTTIFTELDVEEIMTGCLGDKEIPDYDDVSEEPYYR